MKTRLLIYITVFTCILFQCNNLIAATTYTWKGGAAGVWNSAANWTSSTGIPGYPGSNPLATNDIAVVNTNNTNITFSSALIASSIDQLQISPSIVATITFSGNHTLPIATQLSIGGSSTSTLNLAASGANPGTITVGTQIGFGYQAALTIASGIIVNISDGGQILMTGNAPSGSTINNSGTLNLNGSTAGCKITGYYEELYTNSGTINATNTTWNFGTTAQSILNNTGTITLSGGSSITPGYQGQINNNSGGVFYAGLTNSSCTINLAYQSGILTNAGTFYLGPTSVINLTYYANQVTNTGTFTLQSDASGSATIGNITAGGTSNLTGTYNVQRYITGGSGYRGYRFLSSPVNINGVINQTSSQGNISLSYLTGGMITGGPTGTAGGFTQTTTNPLIYLFDETRVVNATAYTQGENVGVNSISGNVVATLGPTAARVVTSNVSVPVGNAYLVYYVGNTASGDILTTTSPHSSTVTAVGYLNQGTIPVHVTNGVTSTLGMSYTQTTITGATTPGIQQIGNPYPSTIDLDVFYTDNSSSITNIFDEMQEPNNAFVSVNASNNLSSSTKAGRYIVSGQGFYLHNNASGNTITFKEGEKVNTQLTTSTTPPLLLNQASKSVVAAVAPQPGYAGLHLQINQDSVINTQTGIFFNSAWSDKYNSQEDAKDLDGTTVYLSSYSSDNQRLSLNQMGDCTKGKIVKLFVSAASYGAYTLNLADIQNIDPLYHVYLRDHYLKDSVDLRQTKSYPLNITSDTASYGANRFDLVIEIGALPPYQLLSFTGQKVTQGVQLNWLANNTGDYTGFVLQKEQTNGTYASIYTAQSSNTTAYNYTDQNPVIGNNTYRLSQSDVYGNITYSQPVTIGYSNVSSNGLLQIYPDPATVLINIQVNPTSSTPQNYTADIYSSSGTKMDHKALNTYSWTDDISSYMQGVYIMVLKDDSGNILGKAKFIKAK